MARYVILEHDHPFLHWDLMLETTGVLRTFRLLTAPAAGSESEAVAIGDHRLHYLDYEGPVSGSRGVVTRWDTGELDWLTDSPDKIEFRLAGARLGGIASIIHQQNDEWVFRFDTAGDESGGN